MGRKTNFFLSNGASVCCLDKFVDSMVVASQKDEKVVASRTSETWFEFSGIIILQTSCWVLHTYTQETQLKNRTYTRSINFTGRRQKRQ
jgi:hypothetical protein